MKKLNPFSAFLLCLFVFNLSAQEWKPNNGAKDSRNEYTLFSNAQIYLGEGKYLSDGQLLIQEGKIKEVGTLIQAPENTIEINLKGQFIYPSFVELSSDFGIPKTKSEGRSTKPQLESKKKGPYHWNESVRPEVKALYLFQYDKSAAEKMRKMGFGTVLSQSKDGVLRGSSSLISLSDQESSAVLMPEAGFHYSFYKGSSKQSYPSSLMGMIALIKQTLYDAAWYEQEQEHLAYNASLEALIEHRDMPQFFEVESELSILRAQQIADTFDIPFIFQGNGEEYKRSREMMGKVNALILPLNFPEPYDVSDPFEVRSLPLSSMKDWELAPYNPRIIHESGIPFALTANKIKSEKEFFSNVRKAISLGYPRHAAIDALTKTPAELLNASDKLGKIAEGQLANFLICSDSLFLKNSMVYENWVQGKSHNIQERNAIDISGQYNLIIDKKFQYRIELSGKKGKYSLNVQEKNSELKTKGKVQVEGHRVRLQFVAEDTLKWELTGSISDEYSRIWSGKTLKDGKWVNWGSIKQIQESEEQAKLPDSSEVQSPNLSVLPKLKFPNMAYGWDSIPEPAEAIIFRNATLWTNEKEGVLKGHDLLVINGKIELLAYKLDLDILYPELQDVIEIDCKGKHLTTGIIDEHSHIAISRGVNESGQAITAEVSISDVVNSDDVNIYRQLAGGVTTSQLLHGSANPIGGQSGIIKLRWGKSPEDMKVKEADGFIKFALGENVKQSNWGDQNTVRFPQTRMGVEQVFYDGFTRAKEYQATWKIYESKSKKEKKTAAKPRFDLELEALSEILDTQRFITCHSYIQSEINMLMHVGDSMGFRVNTFTHILEGYKLADKMKAHGAAASTFSDWWAYKFEVNDAIPYNGAILHEQGVLTGFNSDDAEMARRLNQEAAKAVKYGGVSEEEAWKFVTLNPAKMLHLDHRLGSMKTGKDADLVLWTDNPLSVYAKVEQTYIDGICYFDWERNKKLQKENLLERERLVDLMLSAARQGAKTQKISGKKKALYGCDTLEE